MEPLQTCLREIREAKKLSQVQLGRLAGCGQEKISAYESGKAQPRYQTLVRVANALQVSIDYLLGRTDKTEAALEDVLLEDEVNLVLKYRVLPQDKKLKLAGILIGLGE